MTAIVTVNIVSGKFVPLVNEESQVTPQGKTPPALATVLSACLRFQRLKTPDRLSQEIIRVLEEDLGYGSGAVFLVDEVTSRLKPFAISEKKRGDDYAVTVRSEAQSIRVGKGIIGSVAKSGKPTRLADVRQDPRYIATRDDMRSLICVPIRAGERVIGVLYVESPQLDAYTDRDQYVITAVADQVAVAIENADMFSQVRRYASEQEQRVATRTSELESVIAQLEQQSAQRKLTDQALQISETRFRALVSRLPIIIYATERISSRRTLYVSPEIEERLGYSPTEWTSKTVLWFASLHPDDRDRVLNTIANAKVGDERTLTLEYRLFGRGGQVCWFRDKAEIIRDDGGRRFALQGAMLDITELKESEVGFEGRIQELTNHNEALQNQNEGLSAFGHMVAHDLKNPLAILLGFAEILKQDYGDVEDELLSQGINVIVENGLRMESIIEELLLLAEVQEIDDIDLKPLDMASIVSETQKRLSHLTSEHQASIAVPAAWPTALGHRPWVQEIWVNYVSNAILHGGRPPKGRARSDGATGWDGSFLGTG